MLVAPFHVTVAGAVTAVTFNCALVPEVTMLKDQTAVSTPEAKARPFSVMVPFSTSKTVQVPEP